MNTHAPRNVCNDPLVNSAVKVLKLPSVKPLDRVYKIGFLKKMGLSDAQILEVFTILGEKTTLEFIQSIPAARQQVGDSTSVVNGNGTSGIEPSGGVLHQSYTAYPAPLPTAASSGSNSGEWDWRNVVIGLGAAALGTAAAVKAWSTFSPYELRRKGDLREPTALNECFSHSSKPLPRLPSLPSLPEPSNAIPTVPPAGGTSSTEMEKFQKDIAELKSVLESERKGSAEISLRASKLRGEKIALTHQNERLKEEVADLKTQIEELKSSAAASLSPPSAQSAQPQVPALSTWSEDTTTTNIHSTQPLPGSMNAPVGLDQPLPGVVNGPIGSTQPLPGSMNAPVGLDQPLPGVVNGPIGSTQPLPGSMNAPVGLDQPLPGVVNGPIGSTQPLQNGTSFPIESNLLTKSGTFIPIDEPVVGSASLSLGGVSTAAEPTSVTINIGGQTHTAIPNISS